MKVSRKLFAVTTTLILLAFLPVAIAPAQQAFTSLSTNAKGQGTLTMGREEMKIHAVVVQLKEDGTGEIMIVTDLTLFVNCTWTAPADLSKGIDLKVTGGTTAGGATGSGKLLLKPDGKSIASLSMQGTSNTSKRKIKIDFVAE